jgi:hypothetical protein
MGIVFLAEDVKTKKIWALKKVFCENMNSMNQAFQEGKK